MCPAAVTDPHFRKDDVYCCGGGPDEVYGVDGALRVMVEVPAEDRQGSFLRACAGRGVEAAGGSTVVC